MSNLAAVKAGKRASLSQLKKSWFDEQVHLSVEVFSRTLNYFSNTIATTGFLPKSLNWSNCAAVLAVACAKIKMCKVSKREW